MASIIAADVASGATAAARRIDARSDDCDVDGILAGLKLQKSSTADDYSAHSCSPHDRQCRAAFHMMSNCRGLPCRS